MALRTCSSHKGRVVTGEEKRSLGLLNCFSKSAQGNVHHPALLFLGRVEEIHQEFCSGCAGG